MAGAVRGRYLLRSIQSVVVGGGSSRYSAILVAARRRSVFSSTILREERCLSTHLGTISCFSTRSGVWNREQDEERKTKGLKSHDEIRLETDAIIAGAQDVLFPQPEKTKDSTNITAAIEQEESQTTAQKEEREQQTYGSKETAMLRNLPSQIEARRSRLARRFSAKLDELQTAVFMAGRTINDITGYSEIDALRKAIERQEAALLEARKEVKNAKDAYSAAIAKRSASQREVNELLQRKQTWSPSDLERFTILYRSDHANEQEELHAGERLNRAEHAAEEAQAELGRSILARYHEEQIWSDKIRRASTYGTWALMGFNVVLFMVVQLGLEPWKRKRLVGSFEEKVRDMLDERKIISPEMPEQPTAVPDVQDVLDMPEGLLPDNTSVVQSHKVFSAHSAKEALLLLKGVFIGKDADGRSVSSSTIYESTRADLAIFSGASAIAGAAVAGLVAALIRISFS